MGGSPEGVVYRKGDVVASCIMSDSDYQLSLGAGEEQKVLRWRLDVLVVFFTFRGAETQITYHLLMYHQ